MRVLISGSHGLIGNATATRLRELGHQVVGLVRGTRVDVDEILWSPDAANPQLDLPSMEGFDAVLHLGGVSIGEKRWTERHKERLWDSRVASTEILATGLTQLNSPPKTFICASAVGYYGSRGDEKLTESSSQGEGFLAELCNRWELATDRASDAGMRIVNLRSGIVLANGKGVLSQQVPLFRLCAGGRLGNGQQYVSWISLEDEVNAIVHLLEHTEVSGPVNLTSPQPVRNIEYTKALGAAVHRPTLIPTPRWMMTAALGPDFTDEVLLASQLALPEKLQASGFNFRDKHLAPTLKRILDPEPPPPAITLETPKGKRRKRQ